jgi:putative membrane protein
MSSDHRRSDASWLAVLRWRGVALAGVAIVVTLWLGATNQLILYINPRYIVFTLVMALIALGLLVASFVVRAAHSHEDAPPTRSQKITTVLGGVVTIVLAIGMVTVPPATLSSATAIQRDVSASTIVSSSQAVSTSSTASNASYARFSVLDWSTLLRQTSSPAFYAGKPASIVGFVTPDADDPANLFYLTRFVITCCAVDAQPVAVPVYLPDWKTRFAADAWVSVTGGFVSDPSRRSTAQIALVPSAVKVVSKPTQPYLF